MSAAQDEDIQALKESILKIHEVLTDRYGNQCGKALVAVVDRWSRDDDTQRFITDVRALFDGKVDDVIERLIRG